MSTPELSRIVKVRPVPADALLIEATDAERAALAARFGLAEIAQLTASVALEERQAVVYATGSMRAAIIQLCAVSSDEFPVMIDEPINLRFVRETTLQSRTTDEGEIEVELELEDSDEIEFSGDTFDLGEAIAQTLGLAIDPYAEGPNADQVRRQAGISDEGAPSGPLAEALAALKKG
ncbi:MAG: DUF177 domain-containing protein [Pseudomonadota bacterium]